MSNLLSIPLFTKSLPETLEEIQKYMKNPQSMCHIVSLNPEIMTIAQDDAAFAHILSQSSVQICDGAGIALACAILGIGPVTRIPGVDFMDYLLETHRESGLRVLFIGGEANIAERVAECYHTIHPKHHCIGIQGFSDVKNPTKQENEVVNAIVASHKPHFIFAAFGSPFQEKWFWAHSKQFKGIICMGVGGGFDFVTGNVSRAPHVVRSLGLEWLYRLIIQPHRWRRQLRLLRFMYLVLLQRMGFYSLPNNIS